MTYEGLIIHGRSGMGGLFSGISVIMAKLTPSLTLPLKEERNPPLTDSFAKI